MNPEKLDTLVERSKQIKKKRREQMRRPETLQDRRDLRITLRACLIQSQDKMRGLL